MSARHLEFLVEEPSMEAFLRVLLPLLLPEFCSFEVHAFQGKHDLLGKLQDRLRGYAQWLPPDWRIVVVVDRDDDDCNELKERLEESARKAGLRSRAQAGNSQWQIVNRIAIEELEAWYFGDWEAVRAAYPKLDANVTKKRGYRNPDAIVGGAWEAFERVLRKRGYFKEGLRKIEAARAVGENLDPKRSTSRSFVRFRDAVMEAASP
jgi:hypothetical protein